jgi:hypothetical protein
MHHRAARRQTGPAILRMPLAAKPDKAFNSIRGKAVKAFRPRTMAQLLQKVVRIPEDRPVFSQ